ncbi:MAG: Fur family transcriptional regulator [Brachybacterium sp.]|nr:Fur family transcriptional regulator [Brachybacterium sp.]
MLTHRHDAELREAGLRVTAPRLATLAVVAERKHADADTIATAVRERLGAVSKQAVYDVLHALTRADLLRRIDIDGRRARYELQSHDNHHHSVCRGCGRIEDVPCATGGAPCLEFGQDAGFVVEEAEVTFRGLCTECHQAPLRAPA